MNLWTPFARRAQAKVASTSKPQQFQKPMHYGSWASFALTSIAAAALIISAGCQNVAHAYSLGLASSEFRALVLAAASAGASVLGPFCWVALFRGRGFGSRIVALVLAL